MNRTERYEPLRTHRGAEAKRPATLLELATKNATLRPRSRVELPFDIFGKMKRKRL